MGTKEKSKSDFKKEDLVDLREQLRAIRELAQRRVSKEKLEPRNIRFTDRYRKVFSNEGLNIDENSIPKLYDHARNKLMMFIGD